MLSVENFAPYLERCCMFLHFRVPVGRIVLNPKPETVNPKPCASFGKLAWFRERRAEGLP